MTNNTKHEDALLKMGIGYFREHILKTLGIEYEYIDTGSTELVELTIHSLFMDFTFLTTQDMYIHVEFQTTNDSEEEDLQRFHAYEAMYSHKTGKKVITYVVYSGGIKKTDGSPGKYLSHSGIPVQVQVDTSVSCKHQNHLRHILSSTW